MLRYQPDEWMVHFVTVRCLQSRYLLRPSHKVRSLMVGVLERASERTGCRLLGAVALSGHIHLLVSSQTAAHLADYMQFVNGNVAREVGKLHRWQGKFWHRRYNAALCLDEAAQVDRLAYLLSHGPKENLVRSARSWPGLHTFAATCEGRKLHGVWVDRTAQFEAGRRGNGGEKESDFSTPCTLTLHKLPCWEHLDDTTYAAEVRRVYNERVAEYRPDNSAPVLGVKTVLQQNPHDAPQDSDDSPAPLCHSATRATRDEFRHAYYEFVGVYRQALARVRRHVQRRGLPTAGIPPGGLRPVPT